jgi:hypothetical protein
MQSPANKSAIIVLSDHGRRSKLCRKRTGSKSVPGNRYSETDPGCGECLGRNHGKPDKAIPDKIMASARCVVVIPSMVHIGIGFGSYGRGVATCHNANGWGAPAPVTITGGSCGLQIGGRLSTLW